MRCKKLTTIFTEYIPAELEPETLYISMTFETAVHLCACGCETKIVTPFGPHDWVLTFDGSVSMRPSVGNGQQPCRSHYYIRNNGIDWLPPISTGATRAAGARDRAAHIQAGNLPLSEPWWRRMWVRIRRITRSG
jgi:hypothetical protein